MWRSLEYHHIWGTRSPSVRQMGTSSLRSCWKLHMIWCVSYHFHVLSCNLWKPILDSCVFVFIPGCFKVTDAVYLENIVVVQCIRTSDNWRIDVCPSVYDIFREQFWTTLLSDRSYNQSYQGFWTTSLFLNFSESDDIGAIGDLVFRRWNDSFFEKGC